MKALGTVEVNNGVRVILSKDLGKYYQWFIKKEFPWIKTQLPSFGIHSTLVNPTIHGITDFSPVQEYHGKEVELDYEPEIIQSPRNFWLPAKCQLYYEIKGLLGFEETHNWLGIHITIANTKGILR